MSKNYRSSKTIVFSKTSEEAKRSVLNKPTSESVENTATEDGEGSDMSVLNKPTSESAENPATEDGEGSPMCVEYTYTEDQLADLKALKEFHAEGLVVVNEHITKGYSYKDYPKTPKRTFKQIVQNNNNNESKTKKFKSDWKNMKDSDFNRYLQGLMKSNVTPNESCTQNRQDEMSTTDIKDMGAFLKGEYLKVKQDENASLKRIIRLGKYLICAKDRFKLHKIETKCKDTWPVWLLAKTDINAESAKQYIRIATLVKKYPKLENLYISFTHMWNMIKKIEILFIKDRSIALYWETDKI